MSAAADAAGYDYEWVLDAVLAVFVAWAAWKLFGPYLRRGGRK